MLNSGRTRILFQLLNEASPDSMDFLVHLMIESFVFSSQLKFEEQYRVDL
jgi:hypothetical protein